MVVFALSFGFEATGVLVERVPDVQQDTFGIIPPLMIPEAYFGDALCSKPFCSPAVERDLFGQTVLKSIELPVHMETWTERGGPDF